MFPRKPICSVSLPRKNRVHPIPCSDHLDDLNTLDSNEANKTLHVCYIEQGSGISYVVRSIKISDLLLTSSSSVVGLKNVAYKSGCNLPFSVGCGLFGSQIVFSGGMTYSPRNSPIYHKDVYAFETDSKKKQQQCDQDGSKIMKMDAKLLNVNGFPFMMVLGGVLCALSFKNRPSFEAFDPEKQTWNELPIPPFVRRYSSRNFGYAITGTKMFVSYGESSMVYCFDIARRIWRVVDSMKGPFPFHNDALVLDLPGHHPNNVKLMFACVRYPQWSLAAYITFLEEGEECITEIGNYALPSLPPGFDFSEVYYTRHIGGRKGCLVAPILTRPEGEEPRASDDGTHKITGVAIPFHFEVDTTKIDKDIKNCLTLEFMSTRVLESFTSPGKLPYPDAPGSFIV